ncbi:MAG: type IV-A pilus assembly ATPase PilB, partial [Candidatus Porifericomitaceae bacterium WSBS_2022_MAG_OTU9]
QRLARRLHSSFRKTLDIPKKALLEYGFTEEDLRNDPEFYEPVEGNDECPSGYKGRVGIYQVMPISETMRRLIIEGANAVQLAEQANKEGVADIRRSGLVKAMSGVTTLSEISRVTVE